MKMLAAWLAIGIAVVLMVLLFLAAIPFVLLMADRRERDQ